MATPHATMPPPNKPPLALNVIPTEFADHRGRSFNVNAEPALYNWDVSKFHLGGQGTVLYTFVDNANWVLLYGKLTGANNAPEASVTSVLPNPTVSQPIKV